MRNTILIVMLGIGLGVLLLSTFWSPFAWLFLILVPVYILAVIDASQEEHSLRRNFPFVARGRWSAELLRPFVRQYFIESDIDGAPISRMFRSIVYQRAKGDIDTNPYGTKLDVYNNGYEWLGHSLKAENVEGVEQDPRVLVGGRSCRQPYSANILNVSAMSYGAISSAAIRALNLGARAGNFYHNTGEGGLSPYHLEGGGDLVWQIGTGYFGCRRKNGRFDATLFTERATLDNVKMIELKLSQGAKPGHGGILPASKNSPDIARIRTVEPYQDVVSPSYHPEFSTPRGLLEFLQQLREESGYKPVGFKLCIGRPVEFVSICKAMVETGILPDFITVDGGEGGTGAAPLEYSNSVGMPLREGLALVDDCLAGFGIRDQVRVIAAGKVLTSFHLAKNLALGADIINSARAMMIALGCVQSLVCHTNQCPTGIATQDPGLIKGLVVSDKYERVHRYHAETIRAFVDLLSSTGNTKASELTRRDIFRRINQQRVMRYDEIFPPVPAGAFLSEPWPTDYAPVLREASADRFG